MEKKTLLTLLAGVACLLLTMTNCSDNDVISAGDAFSILIVDENGNNLLDPAVEGNLIGKFSGQVIYAGGTLPLYWSGQVCEFIKPDPLPGLSDGVPLNFGYSSKYGRYELVVDSWNGDKNWKTSFTVRFPEYDIEFKVDGSHKIGDSAKWYVNGEPCGPIVVDEETLYYVDYKIVLPIK